MPGLSDPAMCQHARITPQAQPYKCICSTVSIAAVSLPKARPLLGVVNQLEFFNQRLVMPNQGSLLRAVLMHSNDLGGLTSWST